MHPTKTAFYPFEFGFLKIAYTQDAVLSIVKADGVDDNDIHSALSDTTYRQLREYLDGERRSFDFPFVMNGTPFQKKVWEALLDIPYGQTRTYAQIAEYIGNPKAFRAVGLANAKNPLWIVVPCHRVIGSNGHLTGYSGGLDMKEALLRIEQGSSFVVQEQHD